jgi:hypothetical protein
MEQSAEITGEKLPVGRLHRYDTHNYENRASVNKMRRCSGLEHFTHALTDVAVAGGNEKGNEKNRK